MSSRPQPWSTLETYLRNDYRNIEANKPWQCPDGVCYERARVKESLNRIKHSDPSIFMTLEFIWLYKDISKNSLSQSRGIDPSTLARVTSKGLCMLKNYLTYSDIVPDLGTINIICCD